jgi:hypothetical protein
MNKQTKNKQKLPMSNSGLWFSNYNFSNHHHPNVPSLFEKLQEIKYLKICSSTNETSML